MFGVRRFATERRDRLTLAVPKEERAAKEARELRGWGRVAGDHWFLDING